MRWRIYPIACLIVFVLLSSLASAETFEVSVSRGNIRAGPSTRDDILGRVTRGEKFEVLERRGPWLKIQWLGRDGWVHKGLGRVVKGTLRTIEAGPAPAPAGGKIYGQSFAIVVGINAYRNPSLRLHYAVNDATSIRAALRRLGFPSSNNILLTDGQATGMAVRTAFNSLIQRTGLQDRVVFFYAGHGVTLDRPGGGAMGYLLPVEADPGNIVGTGLPMSEVRDLAGLLQAKHVFFAVDACFSGLLASRSVPRVEMRVDPAYLTRGRLRQILTAGERDQPVLEEAGHGLFTRRLLEALEGEADTSPRDGILTGMEIAAFVQGRVIAASSSRQTPFFGTMEGIGQFVFELPGAASPSPPVARVETPPRPKPPAPPATASLEMGDVFVKSDPAGAAIFVDGRETGKKTPELLAGLAAGSHRLFVKKGEELGAFRDVEVKAGELMNLDLRLEPLHGELYARMRPFGAIVVVDGKKLGETPLKVKVPAGERLVVVRKRGYHSFKGKVGVRFGETTVLATPLREIPRGTLIVESTPPGAVIFIDGTNMGKSPKALRLFARRARLELRKPGYKKFSTDVEVPANKTNRLAYVLPELPFARRAQSIIQLALQSARDILERPRDILH
ncbi:MAG: PEGA domain-containing protein, partial [bacterium]